MIQGFIDGVKSGECPPWAKDASRGFLLREEGGNRVMLTILIPAGKAQKDGLAFFIDKGPKANPLWAESDKTWKDPAVPIQATASTGFLIRGAPPESMKGKWFGQYRLGWNGKVEDWVPLFTSPEATDFHNSVGIPFSVAHEIVRGPGNTYATKAKTGIEVFHPLQLQARRRELAKVFTPESPFFAGEKRYVGPYEQTLWKIEDDIIFKAWGGTRRDASKTPESRLYRRKRRASAPKKQEKNTRDGLPDATSRRGVPRIISVIITKETHRIT